MALAIGGLFALPGWVAAGPSGGQVVAGQASIQQAGQATRIDQQSQRAAIDWRSFNVGANESVQFNQPGANAAILNRVVGNDASAIFGRISANGQVYLVNPNGILFGRSAQVDVGSLMATTANISNADFMAGRMAFTQPGKPGATVRNEGSISIGEGGFVGLVGPGVSNAGVINARLGKVTLAGGDAFVIDLYGDKLVNLVVDPNLMPVLTDAGGQPLSASVDHRGTIVAPGGKVTLTVDTVKRLMDNVIHVSGQIKATSFETAQGVISLRGDTNTVVNVSGRLDVASAEAKGGRIEATGREVTLTSTAVADASGITGGGSVSIGGDWQGKGALANASTTRIDADARIDASATQQGDGGTVVVWADDSTRFAGSIATRGGTQSGSGGQVEVSGKQQLRFSGVVDTAAPKGQAGTLLLDPRDITIAAAGAASLPAAGSAGDATIAAETVSRILGAGTSVTLQADRDIAINAAVDGRAASGGAAGGGLTLTAGNDIGFNANVLLRDGALNATAGNQMRSATGSILYTGAAGLTLAGANGVDVDRLVSSGSVDLRSSAGGVTVRSAITGLGEPATSVGSLTVNAARDVRLNGALVGDASRAGGALSVRAGGDITLAGGAAVRANSTVEMIAGRTLTVNEGGIELVGNGGDVTLSGRDGVTLNGSVGFASSALASNGINPSAQISISAERGAVTQRVDANAARNSTINAGRDASRANVTMVGTSISAGDIIAQGTVSLTSRAADGAAAGDVVLNKALGGPTTGYREFALGYQESLKPNVGRLQIESGRSALLSALNLDGNADGGASTNGLQVSVANRMVAPEAIAVNKGGILMSARGQDATDGLYLGNNLFSRGYDLVLTPGSRQSAPDGQAPTLGNYRKTEYPITLRGNSSNSIVLFDNTKEIAYVPNGQWYAIAKGTDGQQAVYGPVDGATINGQYGFMNTLLRPNGDYSVQLPVVQPIAKIIVGNEVANYSIAGERSYLVPPTQGIAPVQLTANMIAAADVRADVTSFMTGSVTLRSLSEALIGADGLDTTQTNAGGLAVVGTPPRGIALKLLGASASGDASSAIERTHAAFYGPDRPHVEDPRLTAEGLGDLSVSAEEVRAKVLTRYFGRSQGSPGQTEDGPYRVTFELRDSLELRDSYEGGNRIGLAAVVTSIAHADGTALSAEKSAAEGGHDGGLIVGKSYRIEFSSYAPEPSSGAARFAIVQSRVDSTTNTWLKPSAESTFASRFVTGETELLDDETTGVRSYVVRDGYVYRSAVNNGTNTSVLLFDGVVNNGGKHLRPNQTTLTLPPSLMIDQPGQNSSVLTNPSRYGQVGAGFGDVNAPSFPPPEANYVAAPADTNPSTFVESISTALSTAAAQSREGRTVSLAVVVGSRPTAEADFGRGGALSGASANVFVRRYRVTANGEGCATAGDDESTSGAAAVCVP